MTETIKHAGAVTLQNARSAASFIPSKWRGAIYSALATVTLLEQVWDVVPPVLEGKSLATLNILGFGMAALNARTTDVG